MERLFENLQSIIKVIQVFDNFLSFFNKQINKSSSRSDEVLQKMVNTLMVSLRCLAFMGDLWEWLV